MVEDFFLDSLCLSNTLNYQSVVSSIDLMTLVSRLLRNFITDCKSENAKQSIHLLFDSMVGLLIELLILF